MGVAGRQLPPLPLNDRRSNTVLTRFSLKMLAVLSVCISTIGVHANAVETATVDRLLQREHIHNVVIDDERGVVYFEVIGERDATSASFPYADPFSVNSALKKIYVAPMAGEIQAKPLFPQADDTGYYFASAEPWSPDGRYLALYRFKEGIAQPGVFDRKRSRARFFDLNTRFEPFGSSLAWVSEEEFVFFHDSQTTPSWFFDTVSSARALAEAREKGWREGEVTVEIIGGGKYARRTAPRSYDLVSINIKNGKVNQVAAGAAPTLSVAGLVSGSGVMREKTLSVSGAGAERKQRIQHMLSFVDLETGDKTRLDVDECNGDMRLTQWSASGKYILIECTIEANGDKPRGRVHSIVEVSGARMMETLPRGSSGFQWVGDQLFYAAPDGYAASGEHGHGEGLAIPVTSPPPIAVSDEAYYYLSDGDLWRVDVDKADDEDGVHINLTSELANPILPYASPFRYGLSPTFSSASASAGALDAVRFETDVSGQRTLVIISRDGDAMSAISFPHSSSMALAATAEGAVFLTNLYGMGSRLDYVPSGERVSLPTLYHFNKQLADVSPAVGPIRIKHKGFDGRDATGWLYLPPGASLDNVVKYPLVTIPYPGTVYGDEPPGDWGNTASIWDLQLSVNTSVEVFTGQGYAVLLPGIPLGPMGQPGEPMTRMMPAILSALDAAIETGFADPARLALSGHSFGGYAALSVAVQTDRFDAIIAMAPISNYTSKYGQFTPNAKIDGARFDFYRVASSAHRTETGQARTVAPPWRDPDRFVRNSPLFHADGIKTPILLIHGDLDLTVLVTQAEEIFTSLIRQDKDVLFVKYFGEQHVIEQPRHQEDMWTQMFSFLEECIGD